MNLLYYRGRYFTAKPYVYHGAVSCGEMCKGDRMLIKIKENVMRAVLLILVILMSRTLTKRLK